MQGVPALMVSAAAAAAAGDDVRTALAAGFADRWVKPLDVNHTPAELDRWLAPGHCRPGATDVAAGPAVIQP